MGPIAREIEPRLRATLAPTALTVTDDSAKHHGHAGHDPPGESHFTVQITAAAFEGRPLLARPRMVHAPLSAPIGHASCRERVCPYVSLYVVAVFLKKKN